jgi:hypothetical protein
MIEVAMMLRNRSGATLNVLLNQIMGLGS